MTGGLSGRSGDDLFRRLASDLDIDRLESAILEALRSSYPELTALVRIGPRSRPPRASGPHAAAAPRKGRRFPGVLAIGIEHDGEPLGFVGYRADEALAARRPEAEARLAEVARLGSIPARNAIRHAAALEMAYRDPLTGLYNRRAFLDEFEREAVRADRNSRPLALLVLDLDGLKQINDTHGHAAGDAALRALASVLLRSVRRGDIVARIGGDEFAVLFPDVDAATAQRAGIRIRRLLAAERIRSGRRPRLDALGVSFGVADLGVVGRGTPHAERMLEQADAAMYRAKRAGSDQ